MVSKPHLQILHILQRPRRLFWLPPRRWGLSLFGAAPECVWPSVHVLCMEAVVFSLPCTNQHQHHFSLYILPAPSTVPSAWNINDAIHTCWIHGWNSSMHLCQSWGWTGKWAPSRKWVLKVPVLSKGVLALWKQWIYCVPFSCPFMSVSAVEEKVVKWWS